MPSYTLTLVYVGGEEPITGKLLPTEEETLSVEAGDIQQARRRAMLQSTIRAQGRVVLFLDEEGNNLVDERY
jgi:hypothetical protein